MIIMGDLQQTLKKFKAPAAEQVELKAIVHSTYGEIVGQQIDGCSTPSQKKEQGNYRKTAQKDGRSFLPVAV